MNTKAKKLMDDITQKFIEDITSGNSQAWVRPFSAASMTPRGANNRPYRGLNQLWLMAKANSKKYYSSKWMTYKAAQKKGYQVEKGEKGTQVFLYLPVYFNEHGEYIGTAKELSSEEKEDATERLSVKTYTVFNVDQTDKKTETKNIGKESSDSDNSSAFAAVEKIAEAVSEKIEIIEVNAPHVPCFVSKKASIFDSYFNETQTEEERNESSRIEIPSLNHFSSEAEYFSTLIHEMAHWTQIPLRRDESLAEWVSTAFKNEPRQDIIRRAIEELVAEMTTGFIMAYLGLSSDELQANTVAYLSSWASIIEKNSNALLKASSYAQKATDILLEIGGLKEEKPTNSKKKEAASSKK